MKRKHKPARPHWERVASRRPNGKDSLMVPDRNDGFYRLITREVTKRGAAPGK